MTKKNDFVSIRVYYEVIDFGEVQFEYENLFLPCITCVFGALNTHRLHTSFQHIVIKLTWNF